MVKFTHFHTLHAGELVVLSESWHQVSNLPSWRSLWTDESCSCTIQCGLVGRYQRTGGWRGEGGAAKLRPTTFYSTQRLSPEFQIYLAVWETITWIRCKFNCELVQVPTHVQIKLFCAQPLRILSETIQEKAPTVSQSRTHETEENARDEEENCFGVVTLQLLFSFEGSKQFFYSYRYESSKIPPANEIHTWSRISELSGIQLLSCIAKGNAVYCDLNFSLPSSKSSATLTYLSSFLPPPSRPLTRRTASILLTWTRPAFIRVTLLAPMNNRRAWIMGVV